MKWLISLSAAQTVLLGVAALKIFAVDAETRDLAEASENIRIAVNAQAGQPRAALPASAFARSADIDSLSAEDIRMIVREELAASAPRAVASAQSPAPARDKAQIAAATAEIDRDLGRYRARGAMTAGDVDILTAKIAELPPAERHAALVKMTRAINAGDIVAQF